MVGKIKHVRQKLHQEAVKLDKPENLAQIPGSALSSSSLKPFDLEVQSHSASTVENKSDTSKKVLSESSFPSGIFAGTKISPEALVQTLKFEEPPDVPTPEKKGPEEKKIKPKKEKMKERRERWLSKISSIKQAREQQAAEARRQATPVVGDLRPLVDALPELCKLITPVQSEVGKRRKSRKNKAPMKRPDPTDFSQMKQSQKRKLMETETSHFTNSIKTLSTKTNPLSDIGEQLKKRMKQEEEQQS